MYLSNMQKRLLELLKMYKGLRFDQCNQIICAEFERVNFETVIRQLVYLELIERINEFILLKGVELDTDICDAVDVILMFSVKNIQTHRSAAMPFLLTFSKNNSAGKLCRYDISVCRQGEEPVLSSMLESINQKHRIVIIILDFLEQTDELTIGCKHYFAVKEQGQFRLYGKKGDFENEKKQ